MAVNAKPLRRSICTASPPSHSSGFHAQYDAWSYLYYVLTSIFLENNCCLTPHELHCKLNSYNKMSFAPRGTLHEEIASGYVKCFKSTESACVDFSSMMKHSTTGYSNSFGESLHYCTFDSLSKYFNDSKHATHWLCEATSPQKSLLSNSLCLHPH